MTTHSLKCWPVPFAAIIDGTKTHEIRVNDRDFKAGDLLRLKEWDPETGEYTLRIITRRVTYVTNGGQWGLPENLCVMSIREVGL